MSNKQVDGSHDPQSAANCAKAARTAPANSRKQPLAPGPKPEPWKLNGVPVIKHS